MRSAWGCILVFALLTGALLAKARAKLDRLRRPH
jgi:hypothetical protein